MDRWRETGFASIAKAYLARVATDDKTLREIDGNGDLLIRAPGKPDETRSLAAALRKPFWLDAELAAMAP
jgi:hypothetical protein